MSTDPLETGGKAAAAAMVESSAKSLRPMTVQEQPGLFEEPTPEDLARSAAALPSTATQLQVLDHAREQKRSKGGRRKGSKNRASKDFERYILSHGHRDPALVLAEIQSTPPEVLVERSKAMDPFKQRLTYAGAQALRLRAAEALMPHMHAKKPVAVDLAVDGDFNLLIPHLNISPEDARRAADGQFVLEADYEPVDEEGGDQ